MKAFVFAITTCFLTVGIFRSIGIYRLINIETTIIALTLFCFLGLVLAKKHTTHTKSSKTPLLLLACLAGLFFYSAFFSKYPNISILMSFYIVCSGVYYLILYSTDLNYKKQENSIGLFSNFTPLDCAKLAFIAITYIHIITQVFFYIFQPIRTTGLMDDFSQASFLILCALAMAYPIFKDRIYFIGLSAIGLFAFFASFSRTSNFLLLIFLFMLFLMNYKKSFLERRKIYKLLGVTLLSLALVYFYPAIVDQEAIDRGGLSQFGTLNSRTIYWNVAWEAIKTSPFLGHGIGTYAYTGIKEAQPFHIILYVHNDYLQIWHDLGLVWLIIFVTTIIYILASRFPFRVQLHKGKIQFNMTHLSESKYIAWVMVLLFSLYMMINFLILNIEFQIALAVFITDLFKSENENA